MTTHEQLKTNVEEASKVLLKAKQALSQFETTPEFHTYSSVEDAEGTLENLLLDEAEEDCEGSYNVGLDEYEQEFIVDGKHYLFTLKCEYSRHDKRYYYVYDSSYTVEEL
jgi:hypothetical protein